MSYLAAMLDTVGVQVNVGSLLAPYLIQEIVQADRLHLLMSSSRNRCIFIALKLLFPDAALLLFNGAFQLHFIALKLLFPGVVCCFSLQHSHGCIGRGIQLNLPMHFRLK